MVKRQIFGGGGAPGSVLPPGAALSQHGGPLAQGQGHVHPTAGGHPGVTANSSAVVAAAAAGEDSGELSPKSSVL